MVIEFEDGLPDYGSPEFQDHIKRNVRTSVKPEKLPNQYVHQATNDSPPETPDTRQRSTYASFGDRGTTATANGYGEIMRLSRYLGGAKSPSKIFGLEFSEGEIPYFITYRAERLQQELSSPHSGFGLRIAEKGDLQLANPTLEFLEDRWPQIRYSVKSFDVKVRLFCQYGTIIQQNTITSTLNTAADLQLHLEVGFLTHDMDYMNDDSYIEMDCELGPHEHSIVMLSKNPDGDSQNGTQEHLGVIVGLFRNGEAQKVMLPDSEYPHKRNMPIAYTLQASETLEITAALKLRYVKRKSVWKDLILPTSIVDLDRITQAPVPALDQWPFPDDPVLSWHLRRNLEHILSVCTIPLEREVDSHLAPDTSLEAGNNFEDCSVALTCGDFGDHRVTVSGSFLAFQYLLSMYERLINRSDEDPAAQSLRSRIYETCKGHLRWIFGLNAAGTVLHDANAEYDAAKAEYDAAKAEYDAAKAEYDAAKAEYDAAEAQLDPTETIWSGHRYARLFRSGATNTRWENAQSNLEDYQTKLDNLQAELDVRTCASNLWVDGRVIFTNSESSTEIPPDNPANMPMHILKVAEYLKVFKSQEDLVLISVPLAELVKSWIKTLTKTKNHLATAWQHLPDSTDIGKYRLGDHVWIWRTLHSVDQLIRNVEARNSSPLNTSVETILRLRDCIPDGKMRGAGDGPRLEFTTEELRKQIIKRFTLENDTYKKRMLSVTRSARDTRFLFHSRDTILYYGMDWGFFEDDSQSNSELWLRLAESQAQHYEDDNEMQWDNPLRYALAILMGHKGHQLDQNYSAPNMISHARQILLDSASGSGLFPGQMDATSKNPTLFDRELYRDFFFHVGFEIPYVFLSVESGRDHPNDQHGRLDFRGNRTSKDGKENQGTERRTESSRSPTRELQLKYQPIRPTSIITSSPPINTTDQMYPYIDANERKEAAAILDVGRNIQLDSHALRNIPLKRHVPYGKFVDLSNIVEVPEEWLYDYPKFLDFEPPQLKVPASISDQVDRGTVVGRCIIGLKSEVSFEVEPWSLNIPWDLTTIDVRKGKKQRKSKFDGPDILHYRNRSYYTFWTRLRRKRIANKAKKRLVYLGPGDEVVAAVCYLAAHDGEKEHMSDFFDRHAKSREFIVDDTSVVSNLWETELHCSFYQLVQGEGKAEKTDLPPLRSVKYMRCSHLGKESEPSHVSEAAIGFRIVGDFFDRSWTCHIIENFSGGRDEDFADVLYHKHQHWQQRKVLELILFERILSKVRESTDEIIDAMKKGVPKKANLEQNDLFDNIRFENRSIESLQETLQILIILKNNFASVLELVDLWESRESTRGQGRPRWTRNDEQKYRQSIRRRMAMQERCIRDLRNQQAKIEFYIDLVTSAQESIRAARSLGPCKQSVWYGTSSNRHVIITMIITAAIALSTTALVLYCILNSDVQAKFRRIRGKRPIGDIRQKLDVIRPKIGDLRGARTKIGTLSQRLTWSKKTISGEGLSGGSAEGDLENGDASKNE